MNYQYKDLEDQVRNSYSNIFWTEKIYIKELGILKKIENRFKIYHIVLGVITSSASISALKFDFWYIKWGLVIAALLHTGLSIYLKKFKITEEIIKFDLGRKLLWEVREEYLNLLNDIKIAEKDIFSLSKERTRLTKLTSKIYLKTPDTSSKGYLEAKKDIENGNYNFEDDNEIDKLLPVNLRRYN